MTVDIVLDTHVIESVDLVIFDKDGTLMDLYHYWSQMICLRADHIARELYLDTRHKNGLIYEMGVDLANGRLRPQGPVGIKKRSEVLQAAVDYLDSIGLKDNYNLCNNAFGHVDAISSSRVKDFIKPIAGANELLEALRSRKCKIAIATTDISDRARLAMKYLGFLSKIDFIIGADMVKKTKPDPEMIYKTLEMLSVDASSSVMVGDATTDIEIGLNAGLKASVAVLTGLSQESELRELTPYVVKSVKDIVIS